MSDMVQLLRAIIRDELARRRGPELGIVTTVYAHDSGSSENNHQVSVRLRETGIELQHVPVLVSRLGLSMLPKAGDLVLVIFIDDDINAPVIVGSVYDESILPPEGKAAEVVYMPADPDDSSIRRLHLELANGSLMTVDDETLTVQLGDTELVVKKDGDVTLKGAAKLEVKMQSDITLEASGNLELKAQGNVKINGVAVTVEGSGSAKLKGPAVTLAGNTQFSPS